MFGKGNQGTMMGHINYFFVRRDVDLLSFVVVLLFRSSRRVRGGKEPERSQSAFLPTPLETDQRLTVKLVRFTTR